VRPAEKSEVEIRKEIQALIRQITSSVTFLPLLSEDEPCTFEILVYTDANTQVPIQWQLSDPKYVLNAENVRLRSFSTNAHRVQSIVSYRAEDF